MKLVFLSSRFVSRFAGFLLLMLLPATLLAQGNLRKAKKSFEDAAYAEALTELKEIAKTDSSPELARLLALSHQRLRHFKQAEYWFFTLEEQGALPDELRLNYGRMLKSRGKYAKARKQFKRYQEAFPDDGRGSQLAMSCEIATKLQEKRPHYRAEHIPDLNTSNAEYAPVYYQGGIVFVSDRPYTGDKNKTSPRTGNPFSDMYYANRTEDKSFGLPVKHGHKLNSTGDDGPMTFNADEDEIVFTRATKGSLPRDYAAEELDNATIKLYYATRGDDQHWGEPKQLSFTEDEFNYLHPSLSADGQRLFFASDRDGGAGRFDLWYVERNGKGWSAPVNLGDKINTMGDELFPYVHHATNELFFASDLHNGFGGLDIFRAEPSSDGKWARVRNMRSGVNSPADDYGMLMEEDQEAGMISSNRTGGAGGMDLYYIFKIDAPRTGGTDLLATMDPNKPLPGQKTSANANASSGDHLVVSGQVVGKLMQQNNDNWQATKEEILNNALILLMDKESGEIEKKSHTKDGRFAFEVRNPDNYVVISKKAGYFVSRSEVGDKAGEPGMQQDISLGLEKIVLNEPNPNGKMPNVMFDFDSHKLTKKYKENLRQIAQIIKDNPEIQLELAGHACPIGPSAYNEILSRQRAKAVSQYLIEDMKVEQVRLKTAGYGERKLVAEDPEQYYLNRRTEFIVRSVDEPEKEVEKELIETADAQTGTGYVAPANRTTNRAQAMNRFKMTTTSHYTVKGGDTLYQIAQLFDLSVEQLKELNRLSDNTIRPGQNLRIKPSMLSQR